MRYVQCSSLLFWCFCLTGVKVAAAININTASVQDLQKVAGISHKKALKIVRYRRTYGFYNNINELTRVKGISAKWILKMQNQLTV